MIKGSLTSFTASSKLKNVFLKNVSIKVLPPPKSPVLTEEYAPIPGFPEYGKLVSSLVFEEKSKAIQSDQIAIVQSLSGTGALRVGGDFLKRFWPNKTIYLPNPTWPNHNGVFKACDLTIKQYRYYDPTTIGLDINGML